MAQVFSTLKKEVLELNSQDTTLVQQKFLTQPTQESSNYYKSLDI